MKMIMRFLKDYKKECVLAPLFKMLEAIFELFVPLVVSSVSIRVLLMQTRDTLCRCVLCLYFLQS